MKLTEEKIIEAIRPVEDPDIGLSLVDMGLIYEVKVDDYNNVNIRMTLSSPGCPIGPQLMAQVKMAVKTLDEANKVNIDLVWDPPWDPEEMATDSVKDILGLW